MSEEMTVPRVHVFLEHQSITARDLEVLIQRTEEGHLSWWVDDRCYAYNGYPVTKGAKDDAAVSAALIGANLRGLRFGWKPETGRWHYLRLLDDARREYHVEEGSAQDLMDLGSRLFDLVRRAAELGGTRRRVCLKCGNAVYREEPEM